MSSIKRPRVLAVASSGGHWKQMMQLFPAFEGADVHYACTDIRQATKLGIDSVSEIHDYNQKQLFKLILGLGETLFLVLRTRPDTVVSTGAAPGLLAIFWGRVLGANTIWIDSIANSEQLSLSGRLSQKVAHLTLTQWEHLETDCGPKFWGSVI